MRLPQPPPLINKGLWYHWTTLVWQIRFMSHVFMTNEVSKVCFFFRLFVFLFFIDWCINTSGVLLFLDIDNIPGQNTVVGSLLLLQGIFPTQGFNPGLPHWRQILYQLSHQGSPRILEWVAYPFSRGSSQPRNRTGVSCIVGGFFTNWAIREAWTIECILMEADNHRPVYVYSTCTGGLQYMGVAKSWKWLSDWAWMSLQWCFPIHPIHFNVSVVSTKDSFFVLVHPDLRNQIIFCNINSVATFKKKISVEDLE